MDNNLGKSDFFSKIVCGVCFCIVVVFLCLCFTDAGKEALHRHVQAKEEQKNTITTETVRLFSLVLNSETQGENKGFFWLGTGYVKGDFETEHFYVAYEVLEDGGKRLIKFPSDTTVIYDTLGDGEEAYAKIDKDYYGRQKIRLYVPKGTMYQEFDLSLME